MRHRSRGRLTPVFSGARRGPSLVGTALLSLLFAVSPAACGLDSGEAAPDPFAELRARLDLDADVPIHTVTLGGRGARQHVVPERLEVTSGSVVEFRTVDGRLRTVEFPVDSLSPETAAFLRSTDQLESPPLLDRGSRFVVSLRGAPPGRYLFRSRGSGGWTWGRIVVRSR